ncbi:Protein similar to glutamate synthase [NADPH] small chain, clustered with sulfite reductase [hydrothermal vent metagenome]|uniref:Protein similar to glutamate synthase [NADPH] small chain, clustered with sulfite reductase n=1 Tax=hydrothermal vent metagenome TaxID=652676 RepID=A0A3B1AAS3_9ZZZZ
MATPADKVKQEHTLRKFKDGDSTHIPWAQQIFSADTSHKCPTYLLQTPPCQGSCPAGEDIRGWLDIVRGMEKPAGDMDWREYAFRRASDANPFPSVMGRVCPAPCEEGCNRNEVEDRVGINAVEQFIGDTALANGYSFAAGPDTGKKVAIIGGGPCGLSAAYQLRRMGHACTVFDDHEDLGGMMMYGIPGYRTPRDVLHGEMNRIIDMGVETRLNTRVGRDVSLEALEKDFDAILFAIGAQNGRDLPIPHFKEASNCLSGIAFLEAFNRGHLKAVAGKVLVIGGGDTSIDVASVARRLGRVEGLSDDARVESVIASGKEQPLPADAKHVSVDVTLLSRRPIADMTASQHEVDDATREGIEIIGAVDPLEIIMGDDGRARALRVRELKRENGKMEVVEGSEYDIEADIIVAAIGQTGRFDGMDGLANERGLIDADKNFQMPNKEGYFVAGDIVQPHLLTTVIGQASVVAESIDHYLKHQAQGKRPKVDVHHFDLLKKLQEAQLAPEKFQPEGDEHTRGIDRGRRGTAEADFAIHNFEDRSAHSIVSADELFLGHFAYEPRHKRKEDVPDANEVLGHFEERVQALPEEKVVAEAGRCMSCGMCFECDNCIIYCPQDAVHKVKKDQHTTGRYVETDYTRCIGCHICADVCPTAYIKMGLGE